MADRRLQKTLIHDLNKKMVLLAGPRQCGKTTLAASLPKAMRRSSAYYNWDLDDDRDAILAGKLTSDAQLWIFDELHKFRRWRNWLKGIYDTHHQRHQILVTGSARLDAYSRGGDSLQGRYYFHRLHPFTLAEYAGLTLPEIAEIPQLSNSLPKNLQDKLVDLFTLGGFPEPLFSGSEKEASRWRLTYGRRVVREEIGNLEQVQDLDRLELLLGRLPQTVGSPISINSLREDLDVAFETVRNWLLIMERLYLVFRLAPYGPAKIKAVKKEQKLYFWDWRRVDNEAARFENLVALHLLRLTHWLEDVEGVETELRYFRTPVGHEVDFVIIKAGKPWMAVEVKIDEQSADSNLKYLLARQPIPHAFQVSLRGRRDWQTEKFGTTSIRILPAAKFLAHLP